MGELFNKLDKNDISAIDKWVDEKVSYNHADVEYLLRVWDKQKETLYKMFGEKFILNKEIEYNKPLDTLRDDLRTRFNDYNNVCNQFRRTFDRLLWENRVTLGYDYDLLQCLLDVDKLINTEYNGDTFYVNAPDGKPVKVQHGCKPMRLISKISRLYGMNLDLLTAFQNEVSLVLNQKKLKGNLTISIHPLDYMTMSENECGWSSCMNWSEPGCYCRGTVEMMNSPVVVVAYLNAADQMRLPGGYNWSNKKWRELFVINDQVITGVKGYPYQNEDLVKIVNSWLRDLAVENLGWKFDTKNVGYKPEHSFSYVNDAGEESQVSLDFSTDTMYNDFGTIDKHYAILGSELKHHNIHCNYSGAEMCMVCGSTDAYFDSEGTLICEDCDNSTRCANCGERVWEGDIYWLDDEPYCQYCYEEHAVQDALTGEDHHENNMAEIRFLKSFNPSDFDNNTDLYNYVTDNTIARISVYRNSWQRSRWNTFFIDQPQATRYMRGYYDTTIYWVTPEMLTDRGWEVFDLDKEDYLI